MKAIKDIAEAYGLEIELYRGAGPFRDVVLFGRHAALEQALPALEEAGLQVVREATTNVTHPQFGSPILIINSVVWEGAE